MSQTNLFLYGSFSQGHVHWSKISSFITSMQKGTIKASVWRLKAGYPVLLSEPSATVNGYYATIEASELLGTLLDEFHGVHPFDRSKSLFFKQKVWVFCEDQLEREAEVYFLNPMKLPVDAKLIESGNWQQSMTEEPPLTQTLNERQKTYLTKLASASGRDIVPINDMTLYRELMKLDLIVDKGRRLALSKFGHEVVRYLE